MTVATSMQLQVPAQPHEMRDWRGQFTHLYNLFIQLPSPAKFPSAVPAIPGDVARGMVGYLYIDCQWERGLTGSYDPKKVRQRNDRVIAQPSIMLLIKQLRTKFYPGDEEVYVWPITHVMFSDAVGMGWVKIDNELLRGRTLHTPHPLDAATNRLKYLYVRLVADDRAKLGVWFDQLFEEGVLT